MARSYDSWLTDYDGYLESFPPSEYDIRYDHEEKVYMVFENGFFMESFTTEDAAETYIEYLKGA